MKERLDILLVNKGLAPSREKGESDDHGGKCICRQIAVRTRLGSYV